jgi:hypothetical protein
LFATIKTCPSKGAKAMNVATSSMIDHSALTKLIDAGAVRGAQVVAQPQGWSLLIQCGQHERPLAAQRSRKVRTWRKLETLVGYLHGLGVTRFDVDASGFDRTHPTNTPRPDRSDALKKAHEAAAYDKWFRAKVQEALDETGPGIPHEVVKAKFAAKRAALRRRMEEEGL